jgi:uncharacterized protein YqeY
VSIAEQLNEDLRAAMRVGDEQRKSTLRLLITSIRNAQIAPAWKDGEPAAPPASVPSRQELDDEAVLDIVRREIKQRRDSIEMFQQGNRSDLIAKAESEIAILNAYLPAQMSRDEIAAAARELIERVGAKGPADKGRVMPVIMSELRGKAEGREINEIVTALLAGGSP